jgi:hypothetical protein
MTRCGSVAYVPGMKSATVLEAHSEVDEFEVRGQAYRWLEGDAAGARPLRHSLEHDELPEFFTRVLLPQLERRRATKVAHPGTLVDGASSADVQWFAWRDADARDVVWALYVTARRLDPRASAPANDTLVLVAWGDGPVLAWAHAASGARAVVREALRVPPPWLVAGVCSGDPTFPVRLEPRTPMAVDPAAGTALCAVVPPVERAPAVSTNPVLAIVQSWRRDHGREPFAV